MNYRKFYIILAIFAIIFTFFGGSLAWFTWTTSSNQETSIAFTVEQDFMCSADGGGDITTGEVTLMPTSSCLHETYAIQRTITVNPTIYNENIGVAMDLWLDINEIGSGLSNSKNVKYALTTSPTSCTEGIVGSGTFNGKITGEQALLFEDKVYESTTTDTYYLYIWIDSAETDSAIVDQSISLSLNGECRSESLKEKTAYAVYSADDTSLRFYKTSEVITEGSTYNGMTATAVYTGFESSSYSSGSSVPWYSYRESITNVVVEDKISPISTAYWFYCFRNTTSMDLFKLNTSSVTDMNQMFSNAGYNVTTFELIGLDSWDVSSVTNMYFMFYKAGYNATTFELNLSAWDVSSVTDMYCMFSRAGYSATTWSIGDLSKWNVSSVKDMGEMFIYVGYKAKTFDIGDLSLWDVSKVTNMQSMFWNAGNSATMWNIGNLSKWDVSNVWNMYGMFYQAGYNSTIFDIGDISVWNTSSVTRMGYMFAYAGKNAVYSLDLSTKEVTKDDGTTYTAWDVSKVTYYDDFNTGVTDKIKPPVWVN